MYKFKASVMRDFCEYVRYNNYDVLMRYYVSWNTGTTYECNQSFDLYGICTMWVLEKVEAEDL